jgi:hypothetical protein
LEGLPAGSVGAGQLAGEDAQADAAPVQAVGEVKLNMNSRLTLGGS